MRYENDAVESVGDDEDRQCVDILQLHSCGYLLLDRLVDVDTVGDSARQFSELFRVKALEAFLVREQQHHAAAPFFEVLLYGGDVTHGVVGRFLACPEDGNDVVAASRSCQQARLFAIIGTFEFVLGVEVADYLHIIFAFTHFQFDIACLARFHIEEGYFGEHAAVRHTRTGYQHIIAFIHRKRLFQQGAPGVTAAHVHVARLEVKRL